MTICNRPATGALTSQWYIEEVTCGITPANPTWKPLPYTSGNPRVTKDTLTSNTLTGDRDVQDTRLGQEQVTFEASIELNSGFYDDLLFGALGGTWTSPTNETSVSITVNQTAKTFTRSSGNFTSELSVGDIVRFNDLSGSNSLPVYVTAVTATVVTAGNVADGSLATETANTDITYGSRLSIGAGYTTFSILTHYADADNGAGIYHVTRGVYVGGFSFNIAVNANVTGTFNMIGTELDVNGGLPNGSEFDPVPKRQIFSALDGSIYEENQQIAFVTSADITNDNTASAIFDLNNNNTAAFIERQRSTSSGTLSSYFSDNTLYERFINEIETSVQIFLTGPDGGMLFEFPRTVYTSGGPEVDGPASIVQTLGFQALAAPSKTSIVIHRVTS